MGVFIAPSHAYVYGSFRPIDDLAYSENMKKTLKDVEGKPLWLKHDYGEVVGWGFRRVYTKKERQQAIDEYYEELEGGKT